MKSNLLKGVAAILLLFTLVIAALLYRAMTAEPLTAKLDHRAQSEPRSFAISLQVEQAEARLSQAIGFQTISGNIIGLSQEFERFHEFLQVAYPLIHEQLQEIPIEGYSLLYRWPGQDQSLAPNLFLAHQDVVMVSDESDWTYPPWAGIITDEYIYGRGAIDDKGGMMALLEAVEALLKAGFQPERDLYFGFGHDEETYSHGARAIASWFAEQGIRLEMTLDEGGFIIEDVLPGLKRPAALIGVAEKGVMNVELIAEHPGGHASMPPTPSLISELGQLIKAIEEEPIRTGLGPILEQMLSALASDMSWPKRLIFANLWLFDGLIEAQLGKQPSTRAMLQTTMTATMFQSGYQVNVMPQEARASLNIRLLPGDSSEAVLNHIRTLIGDRQHIRVELIREAREASQISATDHPAFERIIGALHAVDPNVAMTPYLTIAATDGFYLEPVSDQVYRFLPIQFHARDLGRLHGIDERISRRSFEIAIRFYLELMMGL